MAPPTSVLSKTLQSITLTKIRELEKQRTKYEKAKDVVLEQAEEKTAKREVIAHLLAGVKELYPDAPNDLTINNIEGWLHQSHYDASLSASMLDSFENDLRTKLEFQSRKLDLADLYSRLLTEWMSPPAASKESEESDSDDNFEVLERQEERLQELCRKFESVVFEPLVTDEDEITKYLNGLFQGDEGVKALEDLREKIQEFGQTLLCKKDPFDVATLTWCLKGLLAEDLLSDEKQKILQDFLKNNLVLEEIADVLNMRYADIANWNWEAGEEGIPVLPRQQLNGKYRIWMDEDVLQAIFIHYVGIGWCVALKAHLTDLVRYSKVWRAEEGSTLPQEESDRCSYFLYRSLGPEGVAAKRRDDYVNTFFLSQLPATIHSLNGAGYDNDDDDDDKRTDGQAKVPNTKQRLLRQLATEVLLHKTLYGEVAVVQSDLQWYATGLSHSTIYAIMRFFGFSEDWIAFFKKFLEAPLNMSPSSATPSKPRLRKRGVPMAHAPEKLIGELVLFVMDLAVNKETGSTLYRLHDDLWLVGEPKTCAKGWKVMGEFAKIAGLEFNYNKTGSVYLTESKKKESSIASVLPEGPVTIGFLNLDPSTGEWVIDQSQVNQHVKQLKSQLEGCDSILSWVQTWNSCIGRFFSHTFGEPAYCFGKKHVDSILETHSRIERSIFGSKNVIQHLKEMIRARFGNTDIPDAFFYLPEQLGGLNLRNPFVPLLLVRDNLKSEPQEIMAKFLVDERAEYDTAKKFFERQGKVARRHRFRLICPQDPNNPSAAPSFDPETFLAFDEFKRLRLVGSHRLKAVHQNLTDVPSQADIYVPNEVERELDGLWEGTETVLTEEERWTLMMYKKELDRTVGGLRLIELCFLPLGVLTMMRMKKVTWQMVL